MLTDLYVGQTKKERRGGESNKKYTSYLSANGEDARMLAEWQKRRVIDMLARMTELDAPEVSEKVRMAALEGNGAIRAVTGKNDAALVSVLSGLGDAEEMIRGFVGAKCKDKPEEPLIKRKRKSDRAMKNLPLSVRNKKKSGN